MEKSELIKKAIEAMDLSYSIYSNFKVGAAVVNKDGKVYLGANIENSSYPCGMCAERNAIYNAYMHGETKETLVGLAIVADSPKPVAPCGICRQVISELYDNNAPIFLGNLKNEIKETNMNELLPYKFSEEDLK